MARIPTLQELEQELGLDAGATKIDVLDAVEPLTASQEQELVRRAPFIHRKLRENVGDAWDELSDEEIEFRIGKEFREELWMRNVADGMDDAIARYHADRSAKIQEEQFDLAVIEQTAKDEARYQEFVAVYPHWTNLQAKQHARTYFLSDKFPHRNVRHLQDNFLDMSHWPMTILQLFANKAKSNGTFVHRERFSCATFFLPNSCPPTLFAAIMMPFLRDEDAKRDIVFHVRHYLGTEESSWAARKTRVCIMDYNSRGIPIRSWRVMGRDIHPPTMSPVYVSQLVDNVSTILGIATPSIAGYTNPDRDARRRGFANAAAADAADLRAWEQRRRLEYEDDRRRVVEDRRLYRNVFS